MRTLLKTYDRPNRKLKSRQLVADATQGFGHHRAAATFPNKMIAEIQNDGNERDADPEDSLNSVLVDECEVIAKLRMEFMDVIGRSHIALFQSHTELHELSSELTKIRAENVHLESVLGE